MSDAVAIHARAVRPGLIAPEGDTKGYEGAGILEAVMGIKEGVAKGDYLSMSGNIGVAGLTALGTIMDPFQAVSAAGVGWLMEHLDILREPLDWLAGDPKEIEGHAATWQNLRQRTYDAVDLFADEVATSTAHWGSDAAAAYRQRAAQLVDSTLALGEVADTIAEVTLIAGGIVGVVRNTVRDLIAEVVGAAVSKALQALLVVTIPKVLAEVALLVADCTAKIVRALHRLREAIQALGDKLSFLASATTGIAKFMDGIISETAYGSTF